MSTTEQCQSQLEAVTRSRVPRYCSCSTVLNCVERSIPPCEHFQSVYLGSINVLRCTVLDGEKLERQNAVGSTVATLRMSRLCNHQGCVIAFRIDSQRYADSARLFPFSPHHPSAGSSSMTSQQYDVSSSPARKRTRYQVPSTYSNTALAIQSFPSHPGSSSISIVRHSKDSPKAENRGQIQKEGAGRSRCTPFDAQHHL